MAEEKLPQNEASPPMEATKPLAETEEDLESLKKTLAEEKAKAERYLANWQRAQADFINYKRRSEQEREEASRFANSTLILHLLPILDDLKRALQNIPARLPDPAWVEGIRLICRKFQAVLESQGLKELPAEGQDFDPSLHEALMYEEGEEGKILEEIRKGYKLHDRVLRPALVKVGKRMEDRSEDHS